MTDHTACPKCQRASGDAWKQCGGSCPMPGSPHYTAGGLPPPKTMPPTPPWERAQNEGAPEGWRMSAKADGGTYKAFRAAGWTDAQLQAYGYLEAVTAVYVKDLGDFKLDDLRGCAPGPLMPLVPGESFSYAPLNRDEIVALTCMQAGAPPEERYIEWLGQLFTLYEGLRARGKRPLDPVDMTAAEAAAHWRGFDDDGKVIEARLQHDAEHLNCPTCGGSGHADDVKPIDMVLHCPACHAQHVDAEEHTGPESWDNPPHRSHLCRACGHVWRPADVPTNGVPSVLTRGKNDSPLARRVRP